MVFVLLSLKNLTFCNYFKVNKKLWEIELRALIPSPVSLCTCKNLVIFFNFVSEFFPLDIASTLRLLVVL